jgi:hypothetical protein
VEEPSNPSLETDNTSTSHLKAHDPYSIRTYQLITHFPLSKLFTPFHYISLIHRILRHRRLCHDRHGLYTTTTQRLPHLSPSGPDRGLLQHLSRPTQPHFPHLLSYLAIIYLSPQNLSRRSSHPQVHGFEVQAVPREILNPFQPHLSLPTIVLLGYKRKTRTRFLLHTCVHKGLDACAFTSIQSIYIPYPIT